MTERRVEWGDLFFVGLGVVAMLIILLAITRPRHPCTDPDSFACKDYRVQACIASERYTREECIVLIGGQP